MHPLLGVEVTLEKGFNFVLEHVVPYQTTLTIK